MIINLKIKKNFFLSTEPKKVRKNFCSVNAFFIFFSFFIFVYTCAYHQLYYNA